MKNKVLLLLRKILGERNYCILLKTISESYVYDRLKKSYKLSASQINFSQKMIIYMADGKAQHGGLSDRLRAMTSLYSYCKENSIEYKIYFTSPFNLLDCLQPNKVNWIITKEELSYNSKQSGPVVIFSTLGKIDCSDLYYAECKKEKWHVYNKIKQCKKLQKHIYTNIGYDDIHFNEAFAELFKPSDKLQAKINENLKAIGNKYISVVFRFQNLIGDFYEGPYPELDQENKRKLIEQCLTAIETIHKKTKNFNKILVTSDSLTFLKEVSKKSYCYTIPGQMKHMGFTNDLNSDVYLKSFVDLYMLSLGDKVILAKSPIMYHSGFAQRAALLGNKPYEEFLITNVSNIT